MVVMTDLNIKSMFEFYVYVLLIRVFPASSLLCSMSKYGCMNTCIVSVSAS